MLQLLPARVGMKRSPDLTLTGLQEALTHCDHQKETMKKHRLHEHASTHTSCWIRRTNVRWFISQGLSLAWLLLTKMTPACVTQSSHLKGQVSPLTGGPLSAGSGSWFASAVVSRTLGPSLQGWRAARPLCCPPRPPLLKLRFFPVRKSAKVPHLCEKQVSLVHNRKRTCWALLATVLQHDVTGPDGLASPSPARSGSLRLCVLKTSSPPSLFTAHVQAGR